MIFIVCYFEQEKIFESLRYALHYKKHLSVEEDAKWLQTKHIWKTNSDSVADKGIPLSICDNQVMFNNIHLS